LIAMVSLAAFCIDPASPLLAVTQNEFGTLPALPFPRLRLTFLNANQLCNYLTVSLMLLLVAWRSGWIGRRAFLTLLAGIVVAALFTLSPGLGAFWLAVGLWLWLVLRSQRRGWAHIALTGGIALALLSLPVMLVTPIIHPTAPFVFKLPLLDVTVAPSVRLMIWMDAVPNFLAEPILGRGIGMEAVRTRFIIPAGELRVLTDAHNAFLHVAVQCGLVGLAAFLLLLLWIAGRTLPLRFAADNANVARLGFGLAFLNGMAIHGVSGSFEDSRHLWVVLGLFLAADRLEGVDGRFGNTVARQP